MTTCTLCHDNPVDQTLACHRCTNRARDSLWTIASLSGHLDSKRARETAISYTLSGGRSTETPVPFDERVTPIKVNAHQTVAHLAKICIDQYPHGVLDKPQFNSIAHTSIWLRDFTGWLATTQWCTEFTKLNKSANDLLDLFDNKPPSVFLGICGEVNDEYVCKRPVYVDADDDGRPIAPETKCECGATVDVRERREELLEGLGNYLATASELASIVKISESTISRMIKGGFLNESGNRLKMNARGEWRTIPTYRVRDAHIALDDYHSALAHAKAQRAKARELRKKQQS